MNKNGTEATHSSLEMQLVRVPRLLEGLIPWAEAPGRGLQDSLGSSRVPEKSLFTAHLMAGSWRGSRKMSCSGESHFLWEKKQKRMCLFMAFDLLHYVLVNDLFESVKTTLTMYCKHRQQKTRLTKANIHYFWRFELISGPGTHTHTLNTINGCHGEIMVGI